MTAMLCSQAMALSSLPCCWGQPLIYNVQQPYITHVCSIFGAFHCPPPPKLYSIFRKFVWDPKQHYANKSQDMWKTRNSKHLHEL